MNFPNIALWVVQGLLALGVLMAGGMKLFSPIENLKKNMGWVSDFPAGFVRFIAACELLGALGLILPGIFHTATILTPIAALGLAIIMAGATVVHLRRKEPPAPILFLVLALVVAIGRFFIKF